MSHASRPTCLISLLQPPPETFQLFDDVIMIADGVVLYHGEDMGQQKCRVVFSFLSFSVLTIFMKCRPNKSLCDLSCTGPVTDVIPFFNTLGFDCPPRKDIPSFLLEVTTLAGQLNYATAELRLAMGLPSAQAQPIKEGVSKEKMPVLSKELLVPVKNMAAQFWKDKKHGQAMMQVRVLCS
jgi:hypothetical protein